MKVLMLLMFFLTGCCCFKSGAVYLAPSGKAFPTAWGKPPEIQTKDYVPLPNEFGHGSSTLLHWIKAKQRCGTPLPKK